MRLNPTSLQILNVVEACCGDGSAYNDMPMLIDKSNFQVWQYALINAALKDNTNDVLSGHEEPSRGMDDLCDEEYNEHLQAWMCYRRRNQVLIAAMRSHMGHAMHVRYPISPEANAAAVLVAMQKEYGSEVVQAALRSTTAFRSVKPLIRNHDVNVEKFADDLEDQFMECNEARLRAGLFPLPSKVLNKLFIFSLPSDFSPWRRELAFNALGLGYDDGTLWPFEDVARIAVDEHESLKSPKWRRFRGLKPRTKSAPRRSGESVDAAGAIPPPSTKPLAEQAILSGSGSVSEAESDDETRSSLLDATRTPTRGVKRKHIEGWVDNQETNEEPAQAAAKQAKVA